MFPDDLTTDVLAAAMAGGTARQQAIAQNIANADTPGYRRVDVSFESALAEAAEADREARRMGLREAGPFAGEPSGAAEVAPSMAALDPTVMRYDGGNVDADDEMARLAANQLAHQTVTSLLDKRLGQFRTAITGN